MPSTNFLLLDTVGEGDPRDPTTFNEQRQQAVARALALPLSTVQARWSAIDLTLTNLAYAPGERFIPPEAVYKDELDKVEQVLQQGGECLASIRPILIFDEDVEGCHAINAGFAVSVCLRTSLPPMLLGMQKDDASGKWLMTNKISPNEDAI